MRMSAVTPPTLPKPGARSIGCPLTGVHRSYITEFLPGTDGCWTLSPKRRLLEPKPFAGAAAKVFLLCVTGRCRNAFEWCLRVHYFRRIVGNDRCELACVHGTAHDKAWEPNDRLQIRLADELHDTASISDGLWSDPRSDFTEEALLQLMLMAGHYRTNAYLAAALRLPVESRVKRQFPSR
jgi:hypothetical protein